VKERQKIPKALSKGEAAFALHCRAENLIPETEFCFHPVRKWRFDFAWPEQKIAVEVEGLSNTFSRHSTISGYREDCHKYNAAVSLGWKVLRYTTDMVLSGEAIDGVLEVLKQESKCQS
jgi:very-short-patch-repair endonuclease